MTESSPPQPPPPSSSTTSSNRNVMIVLSYLGLLALIPLLVEKDDKEVQWHAKHGLVLLVAEIALFFALSIFSSFVPFLGCFVVPALGILILVVHIMAIVKGLNGERFLIPSLSELADKF